MQEREGTPERIRGGPAAGAILGRFLHHAEIIEITGRSYRLKDRARRNSKQPCNGGKNSVQ